MYVFLIKGAPTTLASSTTTTKATTITTGKRYRSSK